MILEGSAGPVPFFVAPGQVQERRLLLITYHFPPGRAIGGRRWQKLSTFAAKRGWSLDVITADPAELPARDDGALAELPPGTRVFGVRTPTVWRDSIEDGLRRRLRPRASSAASAPVPGPRGPTGPVSYARSDLRWWPSSLRDLIRARDAMRWNGSDGRWAGSAARLGKRLAAERPYLACITCGPPHMAHDAGRRLHRRLGTPHIMDLRDPWSLVDRIAEHLASPVWFALARRHERRAVASASLVVMNTAPAAEAMRVAYPEAAGRILSVPNGYDEEPVPAQSRGHTFTVMCLRIKPNVTLRAAKR